MAERRNSIRSLLSAEAGWKSAVDLRGKVNKNVGELSQGAIRKHADENRTALEATNMSSAPPSTTTNRPDVYRFIIDTKRIYLLSCGRVANSDIES